MAGEDLLTYSGQAAVAYKNALDQAGVAKNALFRQYGFVAPNNMGDYSVEGAQQAFDPSALFNDGRLDTAELQRLSGSLSVGGQGLLADISRAGASAEADVMAEAQSRGFGGEIGGGLTAQRRALAEAQTRGKVTGAKTQFVQGLAETFSPVAEAATNIQLANVQDKYATEAANAAMSALSSPVDIQGILNPPAKPGVKPTENGTRMYELKNGFRWMGKKGWVPVKAGG
jgi:hypothetical protein